ncbi:ABC transporter ATP-binding protein [Aurantimonas sp. VKM B-3413]|uniref:ABC transporter ATP-binding protein n=1 Tax=Aurantimonas sp. VKM B-3413 TaxID=2779401 RepID=UPI001E3870BB|nr:ABC transporter ATP-binding protein [Aurantimonas sp. VKM B-3413]MCB8836226.1 ABC transporter ATP-binding protein [Aurantimonas sp. VKM B-3413]
MSAEDVLILDAVSKAYGGRASMLEKMLGHRPKSLQAVREVSFTIRKGEVMGLVGESGCGKSTIARIAAGLMAPTGGAIGRAGDTRQQMIFQDPFSSLNPRWRVHDIVAEPIRTHKLRAKKDVSARVGELLRQVGLSEADGAKFPQAFSGGQRQRISIARALAGEPDFLILDEPTSALDVSVQAQILDLLRDLQARLHLTSLFITHNLPVVRLMADRIGVVYLGELVELAPTDAIFEHPRHPYTRLLIDAAPDLDAEDRSLHPIPGELPDPSDPPSGCVFRTRCPFATDLCAKERPELRNTGAGKVRCHYDLDLAETEMAA